MCLVSQIKYSKDLLRTEGGVVFQRNLEFIEFQELRQDFAILALIQN